MATRKKTYKPPFQKTITSKQQRMEIDAQRFIAHGIRQSIHAFDRVQERLSLSFESLAEILATGKTVMIGFDSKKNEHHVFWDPGVMRGYVAILAEEGEYRLLITVLSLAYHANCAWEVSDATVTQARDLYEGKPVVFNEAVLIDPIVAKTPPKPVTGFHYMALFFDDDLVPRKVNGHRVPDCEDPSQSKDLPKMLHVLAKNAGYRLSNLDGIVISGTRKKGEMKFYRQDQLPLVTEFIHALLDQAPVS